MSDALELLKQQEQRAIRRYGLERLIRSIPYIFTGMCVLMGIFVLTVIMRQGLAAYTYPVIGVVLLSGLVAAGVVYRARVPLRQIRLQMDAKLGLPDSILTSGEWAELKNMDDPWYQAQVQQTAQVMKGVEWNTVWPVRIDKKFWISLSSWIVAVGVALVLLASWQRTEAARMAEVQQRKENPPAQVQMMEEVFEDWEQALEIQPDEELAELLQELQPLREKMAEGELNERALMVEINRIQDKLAQRMNQLESESMAADSAELAEAFEQMDGAGRLAASLRRQDFEAAALEALKQEKQLAQGLQNMPPGPSAERQAQQMGKTAQALQQRNQPLSENLQRMSSSLRNRDSKSMQQAWNQLSKQLQNESQKQGKCNSLSLQLAQMGMCKNPGQGQNISTGMSKLSLAQSLQEQKGAGTGVDPNRFGQQTELDAERNSETLTGMSGAGDSQVMLEQSLDPTLESATTAEVQQRFAVYEELSQQAIEDESLPLPYRQSIKQYFEGIRPRKENP
ncbi:MAG: hypothetical protein AAF649_07630 [Verrucomicrobiota bacterium]